MPNKLSGCNVSQIEHRSKQQKQQSYPNSTNQNPILQNGMYVQSQPTAAFGMQNQWQNPKIFNAYINYYYNLQKQTFPQYQTTPSGHIMVNDGKGNFVPL